MPEYWREKNGRNIVQMCLLYLGITRHGQIYKENIAECVPPKLDSEWENIFYVYF
jgi:hypothetical protein